MITVKISNPDEVVKSKKASLGSKVVSLIFGAGKTVDRDAAQQIRQVLNRNNIKAEISVTKES